MGSLQGVLWGSLLGFPLRGTLRFYTMGFPLRATMGLYTMGFPLRGATGFYAIVPFKGYYGVLQRGVPFKARVTDQKN